MKKTSIIAILFALILSISSSAFAGTYTWSPTPNDLNGLDHYNYYSWGINWNVPADETISNAVLSIANINNWAQEPGNKLFIHLMGGIPTGVKTYSDSDSYNGGPAAHDNWAGQGFLMTTYHDADANHAENLIYDFSAQGTLNTFKNYVASNSVIGFAFDPDCHYYNSGITLTVTTESRSIPSTPEPSALVALCTGLVSLVGIAARRKHPQA